ncbi:hypothetical protein FQN55_002365 [Onygenales sp. PD_40]|nr:hypothetical protein FQN55_002365 [Onygenales sp. PD_40]KAK2782466.1 hypothetical protein FQN52_000899 [Onygenales sp. PD_12]
MATTGLRRTFRYPDSDSEGERREEMDEEEQDTMIQDLLRQDEERNAQYILIFTALPLVSILLYLPVVISSATTGPQRLLCLLSIGSLLSTAYIMKYFRLEKPDRKGKRPMRDIEAENGPLKRHLGPVNAAIGGLLLVAAYLFKDPSNKSDVFWLLCLVPGSVFSIIMAARKLMVSVDIKELEVLKYDYKGA